MLHIIFSKYDCLIMHRNILLKLFYGKILSKYSPKLTKFLRSTDY